MAVLTHDADRAGLSLAFASSAYLRFLESDPLGAVAQRSELRWIKWWDI
jgi:hypothetical protein